jgi:Flp pilus assembly protein TadG
MGRKFSNSRFPRSRRESGSAILEGALIFLPMMALFFALIDFPFAIFIQNVVRNAVREGCRFAISQQTGGGGQDAAVKTVVENNSFGFISDAGITAGTNTFTITYYDATTLATVSGVGSNAQGNICVVSATVATKWMAPVWRSTGAVTFSASSSDVMEAPPNGILPTR